MSRRTAPAVAVTPGSADEIVAILRFANEHGLSVVPAGGFTQQQSGNRPPQVDVLLYTTRLTEVEHYDPGDLTIGIGAGWTVAQLSSMVAADHLFFAADPRIARAVHRRRTAGDGDVWPAAARLRRAARLLHRRAVRNRRRAQGQGWRPRGEERRRLRHDEAADRQPGNAGHHHQRQFQAVSRAAADADVRGGVRQRCGGVRISRSSAAFAARSPMCLELVSPEARELLAAGNGVDARIVVDSAFAPPEAMPCWLDTVQNWGARFRAKSKGRTSTISGRAVADFSHLVQERHPSSLLISIDASAARCPAGPERMLALRRRVQQLHFRGNRPGGSWSSAGCPVARARRRSDAGEFRECAVGIAPPFAARRQHGGSALPAGSAASRHSVGADAH